MRNAIAAVAVLLVCAIPPPVWAADISSSTWAPNANGNVASPPDGFPESQAPSTVNDGMREVMAAVKRWFQRMNPTVTSGGSANTQTLTYSPVPTACVEGDTYSFVAGFTNTGATTLANGACTAPVMLGADPLTGGEIVAGRVAMVARVGANWQLISGGGGATVVASGCLLIDATPGNCLLISASGTDVLLIQ